MFNLLATVVFIAVIQMNAFQIHLPRSTMTLRMANQMITQQDYSTLSLVLSELRDFCINSKVENVIQEDKFNIAIQLKTLSNSVWINFSWHHKTARVCIGVNPVQTDSFSFANTLKALLKDHVLTSIELPCAFERVCCFKFAEEFNDKAVWSLYMEVMGHHSNLILVSNKDNSIQCSAYQTSSKNERPVQTSRTYTPPLVDANRISPALFIDSSDEYNSYSFNKLLTRTENISLDRALLTNFLGLSSSIVRGMLEKSGCKGSTLVRNLDKADIQSLYACFKDWINAISSPSVRTSTVILEGGHDARTASSYSISFNNNMDRSGKFSINDIIRDYYYFQEKRLIFASIKAKCEKLLKTRYKKVEKLLSSFYSSRSSASEANCNVLTAQADLIVSFLYTWTEKETELVCMDYTTQTEVRINIPFGKKPATLAKDLYNKAKRLRRSVDVLDILIQKATQFQEYLGEIEISLTILDTFRSFEDIVALREISMELEKMYNELCSMYEPVVEEENEKLKNKLSKNKLDKKKQAAKKVKSAATPAPFLATQGKVSRMKALKGLLVLEKRADVDNDDGEHNAAIEFPLVVGRNSKQNDRVSFVVARDHHLWFHVQGLPGSHCLLLLNPGETATAKSIQMASDVASFYSKGRESKNVPVGYCSPKFLKRAPGGILGSVVVSAQKGLCYGDPQRGEAYVNKYGPGLSISYI